jgi:uracil-DNA glycosylase family 4
MTTQNNQQPSPHTPITGITGITGAVDHYLQYLKDMGCTGFEGSAQSLELINTWGQKPAVTTDSLEKISTALKNCRQCRLSENRSNIVLGAGDPKARLVFVCGTPGLDEEQSEDGQLLTKIIQAINHTRESVYICNIIKCRPPENNDPDSASINACIPFLERQLRVINPEIICALGPVAAQTLLKTTIPISQLRGRFHNYKDIKLMPTYHPKFLRLNPDKKRDAWEDMKQVMRELSQ